jgi:hypothetical protein
MKKAVKIGLIAAAALVLLGAVGFVGVMAASDWDFAGLGKADMQTRTVDVSEAFQSISIETDTDDITFLPAGDGKCTVVFLESASDKHSASVQDGTLTIRSASKEGKWYENVSFFSGSPSVTVYLPQQSYAALSIEESTGNISLPADFSFERMDITVSTGDVDCGASALGPVRIEASTGDIRVGSITTGSLDLTVSTGRVEVRSVQCAGDLGLNVTTGKAFLTDVACKNLVSGGSTGNLSLADVIVEGLISVERSTGDVRFERCDAGELLIKTDTGDVTGTLRSDKVFFAQSDTGHIDVPETITGGKCKITTDTGDIRISVE